MFKIAGRVLDFYDDPAFMKSLRAQSLFGTSLVPLERIHKIPDSGFAVKIATAHGEVRKWPIYNKTATAISGRYFCEVCEDLPSNLRHTAGHLLKMAHVQYGLKLPSKLNEPFLRPTSGRVHAGRLVRCCHPGSSPPSCLPGAQRRRAQGRDTPPYLVISPSPLKLSVRKP